MDNKDIKNELNVKKDKKNIVFKIIKIVLIIALYLVAIFVCFKSCKNVKADVPKYYTMTYNSTDVIDTNTGDNIAIKLDFFDVHDLLIDSSYYSVQQYQFINGDTRYYIIFSMSSNSNGYSLTLETSGTDLEYSSHYITSWITNSDMTSSILAIGFNIYINSLTNKMTCIPVLYNLDTENINNSYWINLEDYKISMNFLTCSITSYSYNQYWVTSRFATDLTLGDTTEDYTKILSLIHSTNANNINVVYRNEYLFGDLVSSFLNISFGTVSLGGNNYTFTLGLLLLFLLGLGALFLVLKVMLGG